MNQPTDPGNLPEPGKLAVLGAGVFGTVLANILAWNGRPVHLFTRDAQLAAKMRREDRNTRSLPQHSLDPLVLPTSNLAQAVADAKLVLFAIPSSGFRETARAVAGHLAPDATLVSTTKGIESDSFMLMSQILREELPGHKVGVLSGPNLAEEIADRQPTATVIASESPEVCSLMQTVLRTDYFRVYANADIYGVELAGALKNVYAIAAGYAAALGVGQNSIGMLLTRSLAEMSRFARSMGANPLTFLGLAGVGDLFVTSNSTLSRNHQLGSLLGQGMNLQEAQKNLDRLAEGANTVRLVRNKAKELDIYMPLVSGLYEMMYEERSLSEVVNALMTSDQSDDVEFIFQ